MLAGDPAMYKEYAHRALLYLLPAALLIVVVYIVLQGKGRGQKSSGAGAG